MFRVEYDFNKITAKNSGKNITDINMESSVPPV
jgi:hypothetical protein